MQNSEVPGWKKARCVHCAAGEYPYVAYGNHYKDQDAFAWSGDHSRPCTAPTEAEYIAELEGKLGIK